MISSDIYTDFPEYSGIPDLQLKKSNLINNISRCRPLSSVVCQSNSKSVNALLDIYTVRLENGGFPSTLYTV